MNVQAMNNPSFVPIAVQTWIHEQEPVSDFRLVEIIHLKPGAWESRVYLTTNVTGSWIKVEKDDSTQSTLLGFLMGLMDWNQTHAESWIAGHPVQDGIPVRFEEEIPRKPTGDLQNNGFWRTASQEHWIYKRALPHYEFIGTSGTLALAPDGAAAWTGFVKEGNDFEERANRRANGLLDKAGLDGKVPKDANMVVGGSDCVD